ncbi:MAG: hypothetical protein RL264_2873 [Bacteroidota bacterium]
MQFPKIIRIKNSLYKTVTELIIRNEPQIEQNLFPKEQIVDLQIDFRLTIELNNILPLNLSLEEIHKNLDYHQTLLISYKTLEDYREENHQSLINWFTLPKRLLNFIFSRIIPRIVPEINLFGNKIFVESPNVSKAELLGRLIYHGFEICKIEKYNFSQYLVIRKIGEKSSKKPSFGPIFSMERVGKDGKLIKVYKLRTMHPYSEFLQQYLIDKHGFGENGKISNDFRMTRWSRNFRKYWIDELPQLINLLKFNMKLVGVRPVSKVYFDLLPDELKILRIKHKPGCIPPYVSLNMPGSKIGVEEAELIYLKEKEKHPYKTDVKYFFKAIKNIVINRRTSA